MDRMIPQCTRWHTMAVMAALFALALLLAACGERDAATPGRDDEVHDAATAAAIAAAEARARMAEGKMTKADVAAAQARADALAQAAEAEDSRQAKLRAEDEARAQRERVAAIADDRARLGWWATAAGMAMLILAAGASALGWWYGMGKLSQGIGAALAASGGAALTMGLSWGWLPILAAVVILGGALVLLLRRASRAISDHAERMQKAPPDQPEVVNTHKAISAAEQARNGVWVAVQRLRGKTADTGKLRSLLGG